MRHQTEADPNSRIHPQQITLICKHPEDKNRRGPASHQEIYDSYGRILHQHDQIQVGTHLGIRHPRLHHLEADHLLTPPKPPQLCRKKYGIQNHGCVALLMPSISVPHRTLYKYCERILSIALIVESCICMSIICFVIFQQTLFSSYFMSRQNCPITRRTQQLSNSPFKPKNLSGYSIHLEKPIMYILKKDTNNHKSTLTLHIHRSKYQITQIDNVCNQI